MLKAGTGGGGGGSGGAAEPRLVRTKKQYRELTQGAPPGAAQDPEQLDDAGVGVQAWLRAEALTSKLLRDAA